MQLRTLVFIACIFLFTFSSKLFAQSPSTDCSTAAGQKITVGCTCSTVSWTISATLGSPAPTLCGGVTPSGEDGWGWFQATASSTTISYTNTNQDAALYVFSGTCGGLSLAGCANAISGTGTETVTISTVSGQSYLIRVVRVAGTSGTMSGSICVYSPSTPSNDEPCAATVLTVNASCNYSTYTNACATASAGITAPGCAGYSGGDLWFSFTVPASGYVTVSSAIVSGGMSDGGMAIYSGPCGSLTLLSCDDDNGPGSMPEITTCQDPFTTIWVRFWENGNNNNGAFQICAYESAPVACGSPTPTNDLPCNAMSLPIGITLSGNNTCATSCSEPGNPSCWSGGTLNTVWYSIVCPASGTIRVRTYTGTLTNTMIALYSGSCSSLSIVAGSSCNDDASGCPGAPTPFHSQINVSGLVVGNTYYVRVDGFNNLVGGFNISATNGSAFAPIPQQDCSQVTTVCSQVTTVGDPGFEGAGNICDFTTPFGCFSGGGERNSVYYYFTIGANGTLLFDITPNSPSTDYDFMLWNVTGVANACNSISSGALAPVRCNYSGTSGTTGLRTGYVNTSQGGGGQPFCSPLGVTLNQQFILMINNYTGNNTGFSLNYGPTSPVSYSATPTTLVWSGGASTDWFNAQNWGGCGVPTCGINVIVVNGPTRQPLINAPGAVCKSITIDPGSNLTISGANTLSICGDYNNSGGLNAAAGSTIIYNNGNVIQNINGNLWGLSKYPNLTITKTSGGSVILNQSIEIDGDFTTTDSNSVFNTNGNYIRVSGNFSNSKANTTFSNIGFGVLEFNGLGAQTFTNTTGSLVLNNVVMNNYGSGLSLSGPNSSLNIAASGKLFLNIGLITTGANNEVSLLGSSGCITSGNMSSFVDGNLKRFIPASLGSFEFPVGTIIRGFEKATIDFVDAPSSPFSLSARFNDWVIIPNGPVSLECSMANFSNFPAFDNGFWTINSSTSSGTGIYNLTLYNLNYFNTAGSALWSVMKRSPAGTGTWAMDGKCNPSSTSSATKRDSLIGFSADFASVQFNSPFPVHLLNFDVSAKEKSVRCEWVTGTEINNDHFVIQRSADLKNTEDAGTIRGAGNSSIPLYYSFDDNAPLAGLSYYRLKQVDFDGTVTLSDWKPVSFIKEMNQVTVYPNPASSVLNCEILAGEKGEVKISILDITGKIIMESREIISAGRNKYLLNISSLADGFYFVSTSGTSQFSAGMNNGRTTFTKASD